LLCIENEEEVVVEEEVASQAKSQGNIHLSRTTSTLISVEQILSLLQHKASLGALSLSLCF
jgi:hypothetical protein